jgi:hypothetical protein
MGSKSLIIPEKNSLHLNVKYNVYISAHILLLSPTSYNKNKGTVEKARNVLEACLVRCLAEK